MLRAFRRHSPHTEIIVADGGSSDGTRLIASAYTRVVESRKGRGCQMNEGARHAHGEILFFLHADCLISAAALDEIQWAVARGFIGGCLTQSILDSGRIFRWIEWSGNVRARLRHIYYGDQGIFVRRDVFDRLGGYKPMSLFEDVELTSRMRRAGPTAILPCRIYSSNRRWKHEGLLSATLRQRCLVGLYRAGLSAAFLSRWYRDIR